MPSLSFQGPTLQTPDGRVLLDAADFVLPPGLTVLVGANGVGKGKRRAVVLASHSRALQRASGADLRLCLDDPRPRLQVARAGRRRGTRRK